MSEYGMPEGTVYLASDGRWYRWPVPTPYVSEAEARAAALPPPPAAMPPPPALPIPTPAPTWTPAPLPNAPAPTHPAYTTASASSGAGTWVKTHKVATGITAGVVLVVGLASMGGGDKPDTKIVNQVVATEAPESAVTEAALVIPTTPPPAPASIAPVYQAPKATQAPAPPPPKPAAPAPVVEAKTDPRFGTCRESKANGYGPYRQGEDEEYDWYRDADNDGVVCE